MRVEWPEEQTGITIVFCALKEVAIISTVTVWAVSVASPNDSMATEGRKWCN